MAGRLLATRDTLRIGTRRAKRFRQAPPELTRRLDQIYDYQGDLYEDSKFFRD